MPSGSDRADFVFLTKDQLARRYPEVSFAGLPERGSAGMVIATSDLAAAAKAAGAARLSAVRALSASPPAAANGTLLAFVGA